MMHLYGQIDEKYDEVASRMDRLSKKEQQARNNNRIDGNLKNCFDKVSNLMETNKD
jgi:hypothetical protein